MIKTILHFSNHTKHDPRIDGLSYPFNDNKESLGTVTHPGQQQSKAPGRDYSQHWSPCVFCDVRLCFTDTMKINTSPIWLLMPTSLMSGRNSQNDTSCLLKPHQYKIMPKQLTEGGDTPQGFVHYLNLDPPAKRSSDLLDGVGPSKQFPA